MGKVAKTIGKVAGVIALGAMAATGLGIALGGVGMMLVGVGSSMTIASVAGAVSALAGAIGSGGGMQTAAPNAQGAVNRIVVGANNPQPYLIGEAYSAGVLVHDVGYGGTVGEVVNPYRFIATDHSCCGPLESLKSVQLDFAATTFGGTLGSEQEAVGYFADHLYLDAQLGARPESTALAAPSGWGTPTRWGSAYKLSSHAAIAWSLFFDAEGKVFASGLPQMGAVWEGVKVYDPRLDSTYPGGSGAHRIADESTWEYSRNPALHALAYAYGRKVNGVPVFGVRLFDAAAIDLGDVVAWANVCDANGWTVNGTIYEPGDKWGNLKRICEAGAAMPVLRGGVLGFDFQTPRTSLYTITKDDLAEPGVSSRLGRGWKAQANTLIPRYRSPEHQWEYVQADAVQVSAWVTADGEEKQHERQWDLVTDVDQVSELATYALYQARETGPFTFTCKPHMRDYGPGDCLTLHEELGAHPDGAVKVVVRSRAIDPATGTVSFTCEQDKDAKHAAALGLTGGAPTVVDRPTSEDMDNARWLNSLPPGHVTSLISGSVSTWDSGTTLWSAIDTEVTINNHYRNYSDKIVSVTGSTITTEDDGSTALTAETVYYAYFDDATRAGGAVTVKLTKTASEAFTSADHHYRHFVAKVTTDVSGGTGTSGGGSVPPGWPAPDWDGEKIAP